jgi:hypothetical protein
MTLDVFTGAHEEPIWISMHFRRLFELPFTTQMILVLSTSLGTMFSRDSRHRVFLATGLNACFSFCEVYEQFTSP